MVRAPDCDSGGRGFETHLSPTQVSRSCDSRWSGLSMSIVKHILETHKSEIFVKSTLSQGPEFLFNFINIIPNN